MHILHKCRNWNDFERELRSLGDKEKGACFELLTKYYLKLHPKYATELKHVWSLNEVPPATRKKLNLPSTDEGIDLIAETRDHRYWAIQCKYRDNSGRSLTRVELSTFTDLALNICRNIELCLVCSTTERISHKLKMHGDKLSFCAGNVWRSLGDAFFHNLHLAIAEKPILLIPKKPKPHQDRAIKNAHEHYDVNKSARGKLIMPCGTGKSLLGYWIAECLGAKNILVAVPSLALIKQTLEVWSREALAHRHDVRWIAVCSDQSVGNMNGDEAIVLTQDLGVRIHTDPREIAGWFKEHKRGMTVVFATYQSGRAIAAASKKAGIIFDLGIFDEAHKTVGKRNSLFNHLLFDKNVKIRKRVFMTATERRYQGTTDEIISMDNTAIYGDTFEFLSFKDALKSRPPILTDYKVLTIFVGRDEVRELIRKNILVKPDRGRWNKQIESEMFAALIAFRKAVQKYPIRHAVSFHGSIARADVFRECQNAFGRAFPGFKAVRTFHVSGKQPTAMRDRILDDFSSSRRAIVTNARCLTEGVDVPDIDCVLFADPRKSTIDVVQAVGRALRVAEGKKYGYVIVPVLVDSKSKDVQQSVYDAILLVLRALASNDERIVEYFRTVSQGRQWKGGHNPVQIDVPIGIQIDAESFVKTVQLRLWSKLAKLAWRPFKEARAFVHELGLKNQKEWSLYCQGRFVGKPPKPEDIPAVPNRTYKDDGWISMGDWLGTGNVAPHLRQYRPFKQARAFVHKLRLNNSEEWRLYSQDKLREKPPKPENIPASPNRTYKDDGWISMGDWLGTGTVASRLVKYRAFRDARAFARKLGLKKQKEWVLYCQGKLRRTSSKPSDIPANPNQTYRGKGWVSWGDWLGTGTIALYLRHFRSFRQAISFVHKLKLKNQNEWKLYCQNRLKGKTLKPDDIPSNPNQNYKDDGWVSMGDWLGTGTVASNLIKYRSFSRAREFVRRLGLKNNEEWSQYCQGTLRGRLSKPQDIPARPSNTYKDMGWISIGDWLGTGTVAPRLRHYRSFKQARAFAHKLGFRNRDEWARFCQGNRKGRQSKPEDIPACPNQTYKKIGWVSWGDWLGTGNVAPHLRLYRPFKQARAFVHKLRLNNSEEWCLYSQDKLREKPPKPENIPAAPNRTYKDDGWISMGDWLGTGRVANQSKKFRSFKQARAFVRKLNLAGQKKWKLYCQDKLQGKPTKPEGIPTNPNQVYKNKGWVSFGDWLGTGVLATILRQYRTFKQARAFVHKLRLKNSEEWRLYSQGNLNGMSAKPADIPAAPNQTYKNDGWVSMGDWLGTGTVAPFLIRYRSFRRARAFVRQLRLHTREEWGLYCKGKIKSVRPKPDDIPAAPHHVYRNDGWVGMGDWLGVK